MAGSKKRKELAQSSTLLDFFAAPSVKRTRTSAPATSKRFADPTPGPDDIIVVSDDDDEMTEALPNDAGRSNGPTMAHTSMFGVPALLLESKPEPPQPVGVWPTSADYPQELSDIAAVTKETQGQYGEWGTGDDEGLLLHEEEDEEIEVDEVKVELCQGSYHGDVTVCPVCGEKLNGLLISEVERHVNMCIDGLSPASPSRDLKHKTLPATQTRTPTLVTSVAPPSKPSTAFSVLMSSHKENTAWKEASEAETKKLTRGRRPAPFYKVMQGMPIAVDAFRYGKIPGVTAYFLTHAHSDHYTNLSSSWKNGAIYCSQTTANLIIHMLNVDPKWVFPLPMDVPAVVPDTGGVEVTLIPANHCPGSVLFLFKGQQTVDAGDSTYKSPFVGSSRVFRYLHCGDFRACPQHVLHSEVRGKKIDAVYLDTTYLDPKYCFPPQPLVISACAELAHRLVRGPSIRDKNSNPDETSDKDKTWLADWATRKAKGKAKDNTPDERTLVVVGTYSIGKERIVKAIANRLSSKVYCDPRKTGILRCMSDDELQDLLIDDPLEADVHVVPLHMITSDNFKDYLSRWKGQWTKAVGFRPTGWTYTSQAGADIFPSIPHVISREQARTFTHANLRPMRNSTPSLMLYGVPYSEHSSFFELTCFALSLDWSRMIATVNVDSAKSRGKMARWFEKWQAERMKRLKPGGEYDVVDYRRLDHW